MAEAGTGEKLKVFISYSRKDMAFADHLEAGLKTRGFQVLIDREEIYAFEDWWKRIEALIGRADTVVFVLSPDAVASEVALKEVAHAASLNKRFAPIVCRPVEQSATPDALRRLNFIFFDDPTRFEASADQLTEALQTNIGWIRQHTEFGEAARRWSATGRAGGLLLRSPVLEEAERWIASRPRGAPVPTEETQALVAESRRGATRRRNVLTGSLAAGLLAIIAALVAWINQSYIAEQINWYLTIRPFAVANIWPYVLKPAAEQALRPGDPFRECAAEQGNDYCPEMVVVPAGSFMMGSPPTEKGRNTNEGPQHPVTIAKPFAVSKFELTFDEWDTCVRYGDCTRNISDAGWGRGRQPVINVTWEDVQRYVTWLSKMTGQAYRLLTEAEYEYATRGGTQTAYPWGDDIGKNNANCNGCGSQWDNSQPAPAGSFAANRFGLYDMVGNVWEWVEDCYHPSYEVDTPQGKVDAPGDGSDWTAACPDDRRRVERGGSWSYDPNDIRSALRDRDTTVFRSINVGFRVGRTLVTP